MAANGLHNLSIVFVFFSKSLQLFLSRPAVANHTALDFFLSLRVKPPVKFSGEVLTRFSVNYKNLNIFRYRSSGERRIGRQQTHNKCRSPHHHKYSMN